MSPKKSSKTLRIDDEASERIEQILLQLSPSDVSEFRGMNRPSAGALTTVKVVLMLLGKSEGEATWEGAKKLMVNPKPFIEMLSGYQPSGLSSKALKGIAKIANTEEFAATKAPKAAGVLTKWALAVLDAMQ